MYFCIEREPNIKPDFFIHSYDDGDYFTEMRKIIFALIVSFTVLAVSCEPNTSAKGDEIYEDDVKNGDLD